MRLATLFALLAAAVTSALTSGGKEATKRLQVWDSGRRAEALREASSESKTKPERVVNAVRGERAARIFGIETARLYY